MIINCWRPLKIVFEAKRCLLQELETCLVTIANKGYFLCSSLFVETNVRYGNKKTCCLYGSVMKHLVKAPERTLLEGSNATFIP